MDFKVYSIFDRVAQHCLAQVVCSVNDGVAIRMYQDFLAGNGKPVNPNDFQLWCIGRFDSKTGLISSLPVENIVIQGE